MGKNGTNGTNGKRRNGTNGRPNPPGRPSKFTPTARRTIINSVRLGAPYTLAAQAAGLTYDTMHDWIVRGETIGSGPYFRFSQDVKTAKGAAAARWLEVIDKAAREGNWQAAAWKLERIYPESYGRRIVDVRANIREERVITERKELVLKVLGNDETRSLANRLAENLSRDARPDAGPSSGDNGGGV